MERLLLKLLPYLAAIGLAIGGYFYVHHDGVVEGRDEIQAKWDKAEAEQVAADLQEVVANEKLKQQLKDTENVNTIEINQLRANNHALWLRLPKTPCNTAVAATIPNSVAASGIVPAKTETGQDETDGSVAQRGFDEYERGRSDEAYRADSIVEGCRVLNDWSQKIKTGDGWQRKER